MDGLVHRALLPLRDRGVFLVGSGMSYHNMAGFALLMRGGPAPDAAGDDAASLPFRDLVIGAHVSAVQFGERPRRRATGRRSD